MGNGFTARSSDEGALRFLWCCTVESAAEPVLDCTGLARDEAVAPLSVAMDEQASSSSSHLPKLEKVVDSKKCNSDAADDADAEATTADTATPARQLPQSPSKEMPADFGGSWLCVAVTGDMEAFLKDMGLAEGPRKAAASARYGALRQVQNIAQNGDTFVVENILDKPVTMRFCVGEGVQRTADQEGRKILIEPSWDNEVLCVISKRENGELIANSRRYLEAEAMILELTSPSGTVVRRTFQRRLSCFQ